MPTVPDVGFSMTVVDMIQIGIFFLCDFLFGWWLRDEVGERAAAGREVVDFE